MCERGEGCLILIKWKTVNLWEIQIFIFFIEVKCWLNIDVLSFVNASKMYLLCERRLSSISIIVSSSFLINILSSISIIDSSSLCYILLFYCYLSRKSTHHYLQRRVLYYTWNYLLFNCGYFSHSNLL